MYFTKASLLHISSIIRDTSRACPHNCIAGQEVGDLVRPIVMSWVNSDDICFVKNRINVKIIERFIVRVSLPSSNPSSLL